MGEEADALGVGDLMNAGWDDQEAIAADRRRPVRRIKGPKVAPRGKTSLYYCEHCGGKFQARQADRSRGWGKHCSKGCASHARSSGLRPWHVRHGIKAKVSR